MCAAGDNTVLCRPSIKEPPGPFPLLLSFPVSNPLEPELIADEELSQHTLLLSTSGEASTTYGDKESKEGSWSETDATLAAREEEEADDGGGGDCGVSAVDLGWALRTI
ncbi:hypothetical protein HN51_043724 [Arachis hypogaea]